MVCADSVKRSRVTPSGIRGLPRGHHQAFALVPGRRPPVRARDAPVARCEAGPPTRTRMINKNKNLEMKMDLTVERNQSRKGVRLPPYLPPGAGILRWSRNDAAAAAGPVEGWPALAAGRLCGRPRGLRPPFFPWTTAIRCPSAAPSLAPPVERRAGDVRLGRFPGAAGAQTKIDPESARRRRGGGWNKGGVLLPARAARAARAGVEGRRGPTEHAAPSAPAASISEDPRPRGNPLPRGLPESRYRCSRSRGRVKPLRGSRAPVRRAALPPPPPPPVFTPLRPPPPPGSERAEILSPSSHVPIELP